MNTRIYIVIILCAYTLNGCKKKELSKTPSIKLIGVSNTSIQQFKDSLDIIFEYTDNDGDIGNDNPDDNYIQVKDRRLSTPDFYFIKPLAPPGSSIKIKGEITLHIKNAFLLGNGSQEITQFDIKLRDRAGNWSNTISTPEILITQ